MSIQSEIDRITNNVQSTLNIISDTGITVGQNSDSLPEAASSLANEKLSITGGGMTGPINMQGQAITGLNDPVNETDASRKGYVDAKKTESISESKAYSNTFSRPNLLDNWYFKNPVNQRGVSGTVAATGYFIDRWKLTSGSVELTDNGLVLNGTMEQILEFPAGQAAKASVLTSGAMAEGSYDDAAKTFTVTAAGQTIIAAKLELGETQTLAHEEDGAWILNEIPDYAGQLAKCQRYYVNFTRSPTFFPARVHSNTVVDFGVTTPVPMRAVPVFLNVQASSAVVITQIAISIENVRMKTTQIDINAFRATADISRTLTGGPGVVYDCYFNLSAEL